MSLGVAGNSALKIGIVGIAYKGRLVGAVSLAYAAIDLASAAALLLTPFSSQLDCG
jgi:hypothetical protein